MGSLESQFSIWLRMSQIRVKEVVTQSYNNTSSLKLILYIRIKFINLSIQINVKICDKVILKVKKR